MTRRFAIVSAAAALATLAAVLAVTTGTGTSVASVAGPSNRALVGIHKANGEKAAPPLGRPANILLVLTDDQSYSSLKKMPWLSRRTGWFRFNHAYLNNPVCCPTRASILTGQYSHHTGVEATGGAPEFDDSNTVPSWLDKAGYKTSYFGKWHLGVTGFRRPPLYIPPGWDNFIAWEPPGGDGGGDAYYNYTLNENGKAVHYGSKSSDYSTDVLTRKTVAFLKSTSEPFFAYYAPRAPHNPWTAAPRHIGHYSHAPVVHTPDFNEADMSDKPAWWQRQPLRKEGSADAARRKEWDTLLAVDEGLQQMWQALSARHILGHTVVIFMTDNGYAYGEHRRIGKICAYEECAHTPLLVWYPGARKKQRLIKKLISSVDIAPTLARLAGIPPRGKIDGHSIVPLFTHPAYKGWTQNLLIRGYNGGGEVGAPPTYWALRTSKYKYIETVGTGEVEFYDLLRDPYELKSVHGNPRYSRAEADMARRLAAIRSAPPR